MAVGCIEGRLGYEVRAMSSLVMTGATPDEIWPLVRDFHYSERSAGAIRHAFAWREPGGLFGETGDPVAGITYSQPVSRNFPPESAELSRLVRRNDFEAPLSQFVTWTLRWLRGATETPFVLSYADSTQNHHGGIYQACGFVYIGERASGHIGYQAEDGSFWHRRSCNAKFGCSGVDDMASVRPAWIPVYGEPKHLYIFPLRQKWASIARLHGWEALPYPKPNAACPLDDPVPTGLSGARPPEAAPIQTAEVGA